jgi:hypothetical protein
VLFRSPRRSPETVEVDHRIIGGQDQKSAFYVGLLATDITIEGVLNDGARNKAGLTQGINVASAVGSLDRDQTSAIRRQHFAIPTVVIGIGAVGTGANLTAFLLTIIVRNGVMVVTVGRTEAFDPGLFGRAGSPVMAVLITSPTTH